MSFLDYPIEDRNKCINDNISLDDDVVIYEETYKGSKKLYCFGKGDIPNLLENNRNPYSGRLFSLDFITLIHEKYGSSIGHVVELSDLSNNDDACTECKDNESCISDVVLSEATRNWLNYYTREIYMVDVKYHIIPSSVRKELLPIKKCSEYSGKLYRGISFSLVNIPYYVKYLHYLSNGVFKEEYIKPISTSTDIEVAEGFSHIDKTYKFDNWGIIVSYTDIKKSDILVDLNLINNKHFHGEKEVILLPGVYKQKIIQSGHVTFTIPQLEKVHNIFKKDIDHKNKRYYYKKYTIAVGELKFLYNDKNMEDDEYPDDEYKTSTIKIYMKNERMIVECKEYGILYSGYFDDGLNFIVKESDNIFYKTSEKATIKVNNKTYNFVNGRLMKEKKKRYYGEDGLRELAGETFPSIDFINVDTQTLRRLLHNTYMKERENLSRDQRGRLSILYLDVFDDEIETEYKDN